MKYPNNNYYWGILKLKDLKSKFGDKNV